MLIFVKATGDIRFGVVLLDKGDDVFGVQRDDIAPSHGAPSQFLANEMHAVGQQKLKCGVGDIAQHTSQMALGGQMRGAGGGTETNPKIGVGQRRKIE